MRILQIGTSLTQWGGIERYIAYLQDGLSAVGHEVIVASPADFPLSRHAGEHVQIRTFKKFDLRAVGACAKVIRSRKVEIVHAHYSPDFWVAGLSARLGKAKVVLATRHIAEPWKRPKAQIYMRLFKHVIPVSDAVRDVLIHDGVPASRLTVALAGCPALRPTRDRAEIRASYGMQGKVFGYFGRLDKEKGVDVAIQGAARAGAKLAIFGKGAYETTLRQIADDYQGCTSFYGSVEEVDNAMHAVDAVVIPSIWAEAFPFAGLEAMSLGKPILASRTGGLTQMMQDGVSGMFFEPGNPDALAGLMLDVLGDCESACRVGEAALRTHRERFTVSAMAERIEAVYSKLLQN